MAGLRDSQTTPTTVAGAAVAAYRHALHDRITTAVESLDTVGFRRDAWRREGGGGGETRILADGSVFERAG
ncbi:MAG: coproporphyrinogen III oxidase, partial [Gammaproteobacteria bacterium]|nr:coproporphyrinogen III oxidase [Gammaproteobacteria bacterium]